MKLPASVPLPRVMARNLGLLLPALLAVSCLSGCGSSSPPLPGINFDKAKALSDAVAADIARKDINDLSTKLDAGFYLIVKGPADLKKVIEKMYTLYGRPLKWELKAAQSGVRVDGTWRRPSRTFFYAVETTQYPMGKYFLKVEVVAAFGGGSLDVSGFGFFTFKEGAPVPSYLK